jgi:hypothetical protein
MSKRGPRKKNHPVPGKQGDRRAKDQRVDGEDPSNHRREEPAPELVPKQTEADTISGPQGGERIMPFLDVEYILTRKEVTERSAMRQ